MSGNVAIAKSGDLDVLTVLGLGRRGSAVSAHLGGLQDVQLAKIARIRLLTQALAAIVVLALYAASVSWMALTGWLVALGLSLGLAAHADRALARAARRTTKRRERLLQGAMTVGNGLVWAAALWFSCPLAASRAISRSGPCWPC
jgi:hypothetical protein